MKIKKYCNLIMGGSVLLAFSMQAQGPPLSAQPDIEHRIARC